MKMTYRIRVNAMDPRKVIEKMNRNTGITNVILIVVGAISIIGFSAQNVFAISARKNICMWPMVLAIPYRLLILRQIL